MSTDKPNANGSGDDQPLDPAVERVRRKMMRLMGVSVAIMMVGLMAVIGAIFYKIYGGGKKNVDAEPVVADVRVAPVGELDVAGDIIGNIDLPTGSRMLKAELDGGRILMSVRHADGGMALWVYDLAANRVFAKISIAQ